MIKPTAYLINTTRGPIVNEAGQIAALRAGQIAGAGLDVFEQEPLPTDSPLVGMDNVILAPHALAWTDDLYRGNGVGACESILAVFRGEMPRYPVNREVAERPGYQANLQELRQRWSSCVSN